MNSANNHLIIIPGLGNTVAQLVWATAGWQKYGIVPHVFDAKWRVEENGFSEKLARATSFVDSLVGKNNTISLLGNSAGSSFVLNLFGKRKKQIHRVIINCGRVRGGDSPWFTFDQATASSPSFRESVIRAQELEKILTTEDRKKIMTLRPLFDEVVPSSTVPIRGAKNIVTFSVEHTISIALTMTLFQGYIIDFIRNKDVIF